MTRLLDHADVTSGALVAAALVSIALAGGGYGGVALGVATASVWVVIVVTLLAGRLPASAPGPGLTAASICLLALLGVTILSTGWTSSDELAFDQAVRLAGYLGVFLLAGLQARRNRFGAVLTGLAAGGVIIALLALASRLLGIGAGDADLVADLPTAAGRLSYPVGYWNALGALMALSVPPLCWRAASASTPRLRGLALAGFPPLILAGYLTSSRGAVLALALGIAITVGLAAERRRTAAAAAIGIAAAIPAVAVATVVSGLIDTPGDGTPHGPELAALLALLAGSAFAFVAGGRLVEPVSRSRVFAISIPVRTTVVAVVAAAAILIAFAGPSALIGELRAGDDPESAADERTTGIVSASGSGRTEFWETAIAAFADEPIRGIGAGGFADYWNQNGSLRIQARNAHSEPIELLAETGLVGFACFAFLIFVVAGCAAGLMRRAVPSEGAGAAIALMAAGSFSFLVDWTFQVPAVALPVLVVAGMTVALAEPPRVLARLPFPGIRVVSIVAIALAVPAVWASGVIAISTAKLERSADAFSEGRLNDAVADARTAAAVQPWAAEPWMRIADIEQSAGNYDASQAAIKEAIQRNPSSLRAWLLATNIESQLGNPEASGAYGFRALLLGPLD